MLLPSKARFCPRDAFDVETDPDGIAEACAALDEARVIKSLGVDEIDLRFACPLRSLHGCRSKGFRVVGLC